MTPEMTVQTIKCRDDHSPIIFSKDANCPDETKPFKLDDGPACSWAKPDDHFGVNALRSHIEPWLTALFQSEHFSVLIGSGLTQALHRMATGTALPSMDPQTIAPFEDLIEAEAKRSAEAAGRGVDGNIEDRIRVANELLRGLEILAATTDEESDERHKLQTLRDSIRKTLNNFAASILKGEKSFLDATETKREEAFNYLVSFLMSFASRTGTRDRLHLFTTNYDRFIEAGADSAGLRFVDRFVGALAPVFRSSRIDVDMHYNPPGIRGEPRYLEGVARFTKLHGSVDWAEKDRVIRKIGLPFGSQYLSPYLSDARLGGDDAKQLMIYPNSAKDRETASYPYVELFRDFAAATCRPNSTLICYGYSFGDEHINRIIEDMLTIPSAHLVIISYNDPLDRIMRIYEKLGRDAQITLLMGDHLGDLRTLVDHYLPKPAIDRTTFRMAEILKARWGTHQSDQSNGDTSPSAATSGDPGESKV